MYLVVLTPLYLARAIQLPISIRIMEGSMHETENNHLSQEDIGHY